MKRQIRWLKNFRQPIPLGKRWRSRNELPETVQTGHYIVFKKGAEATVNVRGIDPRIVSIAGIGDLRQIKDGVHFEFI